VPVTGLFIQKVPDVQGVVQLTIQPRDRPTPSINVKPWVLSSITTDIPARQLPAQGRARCNHLNLANPSFNKPAPVDMLIGADIFPQVWNDKSSFVRSRFAIGVQFCLRLGPGWFSSRTSRHWCSAYAGVLGIFMEALMERFWNVEEPEVAPPQFTEHGLCETLFSSEISCNSQDRFSVPFPFRSDRKSEDFPGLRQIALNRFFHLERKLAVDNLAQGVQHIHVFV